MPQKRYPRTDYETTVTARLPKQFEKWPKNIEEILLGTAAKDPTGFVSEPDAEPGTFPRIYDKTYNDFAEAAPQLAKRSPGMWDLNDWTGAARKLLGGVAAYIPSVDQAVFTEPPPPERMAHETLHRLQMQNFLDRPSGTQAWNPRGPGELDYIDAPGEQQAFKVEELMQAKRESMRALRAKAHKK